MVQIMAGLLTFMLAFTFWIAASHFDAARQALLNEASAIKTTYLRADFLPEPKRTEIHNLLREYIDVRVEEAGTNNYSPLIRQSEELQRRLWAVATATKDGATSPILNGYFLQSLNDMIAIQSRRLAVRQEFRIPVVIWLVLYVIAVLAVASVGCHAGLTNAMKPLVYPSYVLLFAVALLLIADLDRPLWGSFKLSQQSFIDLRNWMGSIGP
jgi:hypothetical protein